MEIRTDIEPTSFNAWEGGKDTLNDIIKAGKGREFNEMAEDLFGDGATDDEFNNWLWFDRDQIYQDLGINPYKED